MSTELHCAQVPGDGGENWPLETKCMNIIFAFLADRLVVLPMLKCASDGSRLFSHRTIGSAHDGSVVLLILPT